MEQDITDALAKDDMLAVFTKLPPSHKNEYLEWIRSAKRPETRQKRIGQMIAMLQAKQKA